MALELSKAPHKDYPCGGPGPRAPYKGYPWGPGLSLSLPLWFREFRPWPQLNRFINKTFKERARNQSLQGNPFTVAPVQNNSLVQINKNFPGSLERLKKKSRALYKDYPCGGPGPRAPRLCLGFREFRPWPQLNRFINKSFKERARNQSLQGTPFTVAPVQNNKPGSD